MAAIIVRLTNYAVGDKQKSDGSAFCISTYTANTTKL